MYTVHEASLHYHAPPLTKWKWFPIVGLPGREEVGQESFPWLSGHVSQLINLNQLMGKEGTKYILLCK